MRPPNFDYLLADHQYFELALSLSLFGELLLRLEFMRFNTTDIGSSKSLSCQLMLWSEQNILVLVPLLTVTHRSDSGAVIH